MPWKIQRVCVCRIENSPKRNKTNECKAKESEIISYSISKNITLRGKKKRKFQHFFFSKNKMEKRWKKKKKNYENVNKSIYAQLCYNNKHASHGCHGHEKIKGKTYTQRVFHPFSSGGKFLKKREKLSFFSVVYFRVRVLCVFGGKNKNFKENRKNFPFSEFSEKNKNSQIFSVDQQLK